MINKLVVENLKHRWVRTLLGALLVGVLVASITTLIGLSRGLLEERAARAKGTGADIFLKPDTHGTVSFASGPVSEKFVALVRKQPHVEQAVGVLVQSVELITSMNGVNAAEFERISGGFHYLEGGPPKAPDDMLVDESYARQKHLHVGATVNIFGHDWRLAGIVEGGMLARFVVRLDTLQQVTANTGKISQILVKLDDPARTNEMVAYFDKLLAGDLKAISIADFVSQFSISSFPQLELFINIITVMWVVVIFLVVGLSMYTAVLERTREIGILKALGAKPWTILDLLIREAILLALVGWVIGIVLALVTRSLIVSMFPASLNVVNVPDWWPKAAAIALSGAVLGALYPGLKAARQDAIEALSYE
jgi:putative ABC transport system permease protein